MKSANYNIQTGKFLYSWIIVIYHLAASTSIQYKGGYCGVEYFLLTAGMFLFLSFEKGNAGGATQTPGQYLSKRFWRFFPWSMTAFVLCIVVKRLLVAPPSGVGTLVDWFASDIWEILMIKANGMNNNEVLFNGPAWTLSAMLIVGFFIWTLLYYYKDLFLNLIMPLTLVAGFGYWMHIPSANTEGWIGFTTFGAFRTWLLMCLSYYCIPMSRKLELIPFNKRGKILLTVAEISIHIFALVVMRFRAERYYQWLLTLLFMVSIAIAMSGHSLLGRLLEKLTICKSLGDWSMSIYLVHTPVNVWFRTNFDMSAWGYSELIPLFLTVAVVAVLHSGITKWVMGMTPKLSKAVMKQLTD